MQACKRPLMSLPKVPRRRWLNFAVLQLRFYMQRVSTRYANDRTIGDNELASATCSCGYHPRK